jgi:hypothetical protein
MNNAEQHFARLAEDISRVDRVLAVLEEQFGSEDVRDRVALAAELRQQTALRQQLSRGLAGF